MDSNTIRPWHVFTLLTVFLCTWVYSEVREYVARQAFVIEVDEFMRRGNRFTSDEGDALESRLDELERRVDALE